MIQRTGAAASPLFLAEVQVVKSSRVEYAATIMSAILQGIMQMAGAQASCT